MKSLGEKYRDLVKNNTWERDQIRADIKTLEDYTPRNADDFDFREAEITRLRGLL